MKTTFADRVAALAERALSTGNWRTYLAARTPSLMTREAWLTCAMLTT